MDELKTVNRARLRPFPDNPFVVHEDDSLAALVESIREFGVIAPLLVRPARAGEYEIISGSRRMEACVRAGLDEIPVVVREMDDDMAVIALVDGNLQRENVLPSERARAYQMKLDAVKRMNARAKERAGAHDEPRKRAAEIVGEDVGESAAQVKRYIRLNSLEKPLLDMVDQGRVALTPAVQLSYLPPAKQQAVAQAIHETDATPSLSQAMRMRRMETDGALTADSIMDVMSEEKGNQKEVLRVPRELFERYLPRNVTDMQLTELLVMLVKEWHTRQKQRANKQQAR